MAQRGRRTPGTPGGLLNVHKEGILFMLLLKSLRIGFVGLMLFVASAWAASSVLEGIVKDAKGHPIEGADIRIETKNGGKLLTTVKTDVRGRYILEGLPPGNYRVTLAVNGAVKTSINNTTIESDAPTQLNFDLACSASVAGICNREERAPLGLDTRVYWKSSAWSLGRT